MRAPTPVGHVCPLLLIMFHPGRFLRRPQPHEFQKSSSHDAHPAKSPRPHRRLRPLRQRSRSRLTLPALTWPHACENTKRATIRPHQRSVSRCSVLAGPPPMHCARRSCHGNRNIALCQAAQTILADPNARFASTVRVPIPISCQPLWLLSHPLPYTPYIRSSGCSELPSAPGRNRFLECACLCNPPAAPPCQPFLSQ